MASQLGKQTIAMQILPYNSRSKGKQIMKFDQLMECNMGNIFLANSYAKYGGKLLPDPFLKN